jgi:hypothetical protein
MSDFRLRRGDSRTLNISGLVDPTGNPTTFANGDVVRFTVKRSYEDSDDQAIVRADTGNATVDNFGGITLDINADTGTIALTPDSWLIDKLTRPTRCVYDLQHDRSGTVTTLRAGECDVLPDVTRTDP